jgi:hypothetical protein
MALSGFVADNAGFLRSDAHLAVVYITDEDDCSAPCRYHHVRTADHRDKMAAFAARSPGHVCNGQSDPRQRLFDAARELQRRARRRRQVDSGQDLSSMR